MFVFIELHRRLMLLGGFASLSADQFKKFPESCKKLRAAASDSTISGAQFYSNVRLLKMSFFPGDVLKFFFYFNLIIADDLQVLTRNALRDVSADASLCQILRRAKPDPRLDKMAVLVEKLKTWAH